MDRTLLPKRALLFIFIMLGFSTNIMASHVKGGNITYKWVSGNLYEITLVLYRDCSGASAPNPFATVNIVSASCGIIDHIDLPFVQGSGGEVSPICSSMQTKCGNPASPYPGVQEYYYSGMKTLPPCTDWVLSFTLCCRSTAINTIVTPGSTPMYLESTLDNLNFPGNSSPKFTNQAVPFICVGLPYVFDNGSFDIDGDTLTYQLINPKTTDSTDVTFNAGYSANQPIASSPAAAFNSVTGELHVTPTNIEVGEFAVLVTQWHNGSVIGTVVRDVQVRTVACLNNDPFLNGIFNTGVYNMSVVAGAPFSFDIPSFDTDANQTLTLSWNLTIPGATFTVDTSISSTQPTGVFSWTPTLAQVSPTSYCFTVTVKDNNCPYNGSRTYPFCIKVGNSSTLSAYIGSKTDLACNGVCTGAATVMASGGALPYDYNWSAGVGTTSSVSGLCAGTYNIAVTDTLGTTVYVAVTLTEPSPIISDILSTNASSCVACDGTASLVLPGSAGSYTINWSNSSSAITQSNLCEGYYSVIITDSSSCTETDSIIIFSKDDVSTNFSMVPDSTNSYNFLGFNASTGTGATYHWDFGDGNVSSLTKPWHQYAGPGTYNVCLITTSVLCGTDTLCKELKVDGNLNSCVSLFNIADDTTSDEPNAHTVYNLSYGSNLSYYWTFGDGSTSTLMNPSHVYSGKGPYFLCLSVNSSTGCENTYCDTLISIDPIGRSGGTLRINVFDVELSANKLLQANNDKISVYPNPFNDFTTFNIQSNVNDIYTFELIDVLGKSVKYVEGIKSKEFQMTRNGLESGIYFYKISNSETPLFIGKIVIE